MEGQEKCKILMINTKTIYAQEPATRNQQPGTYYYLQKSPSFEIYDLL